MRSIKFFWELLNSIEHLLILVSTVTKCVLISTFASFVGIPVGITSSAVELIIYVITAGIKEYKSIMKKKNKRHRKMVSLPKSKLNIIEVLISIAWIDSNIIHIEFVSINDMMKEYNDMEK